MTKDVAVINDEGIVIAINVYPNNYELSSNEILVTNPAFVGGDYVDGYFYPPQPYSSWTRNNGKWIPPVDMPQDNKKYIWNEETLSWDLRDYI
jgi:hypothetical protein